MVSADTHIHKLEIYTGMKDKNRLHSEVIWVVVRLTRNIQCNQSFRLYFDYPYASLTLVHYPPIKSVYSLESIRRNLIPNCKLLDKHTMKKERMGKVLICQLLYGKTIILLHLYQGLQENYQYNSLTGTIKSKKSIVKIDSPDIIKEYFRHWGGVDF